MKKVVALIPAAGAGTRMGKRGADSVPKQFMSVGNVPLLAHTLLAFQRSTEVDEIIPILALDDLECCLGDIIEKYHITKVKALVAGGKERQDSVRNGLEKIGKDAEIVLVHDGVRPFVTHDMITATVAIAKKGGAATVGVPIKDTIKEVDDDGMVHRTLERSRLWAVQTPQAFPVAMLKHAYEESDKEKIFGTDDAMLVERTGGKVQVVMGSYENIKITTPEDLMLAEEILRKRMR